MKALAPSKKTSIKVLYAAFQVLSQNENELPGKEVIEKIREQVDFTDWEKARYEKTGYVRWESILHFHTVGAIKGGYIQKKNGIWYLTDEGAKLVTLTPEELRSEIDRAYKEWDDNRPKKDKDPDSLDGDNNPEQQNQAMLQQLEDQAITSIEEYIRSLNPYEFQDLVAALLRGMGYFTPFIAPKGKDGGIDIVAYKDPIGAEKPIIRVQVKHHPDNPIQTQDIQKLKGALSHDEDIGIFVTSGKFSSACLRESRNSKSHIEMIGFSRFIELWKQFYPKMTDEDKSLLPLYPVYFLRLDD